MSIDNILVNKHWFYFQGVPVHLRPQGPVPVLHQAPINPNQPHPQVSNSILLTWWWLLSWLSFFVLLPVLSSSLPLILFLIERSEIAEECGLYIRIADFGRSSVNPLARWVLIAPRSTFVISYNSQIPSLITGSSRRYAGPPGCHPAHLPPAIPSRSSARRQTYAR